MTQFILVATIGCIGVTGCAVTKLNDEDNWYLRSEFTWWEANAQHRFESTSGGHELVTTITSDGQPYHLKVADRMWSNGKNCGLNDSANTELRLNKWLQLNCGSSDNNVQSLMPLKGAITFRPERGKHQYKFEFVHQPAVASVVNKSGANGAVTPLYNNANSTAKIKVTIVK